MNSVNTMTICRNCTGEPKRKEYEELLDVVSTNETYFFRNERHFEALMDVCLPELSKSKKR